MWTRETKDLKPGFYWFTFEMNEYHKEGTIPIQVLDEKCGKYPETMEFGSDCYGPSLYPQDMEKQNAWIWSIPMEPPLFTSTTQAKDN